MGVCCSKKEVESFAQKVYLAACTAIDRREPQELHEIVNKHFRGNSFLDIDAVIISLNGIPMGLLAYSISVGASGCSAVLLRHARANIPKVYEQLSVLALSPLDLLCETGDLIALREFLPLYLKQSQNLPSAHLYTPIQKAAAKGLARRSRK